MTSELLLMALSVIKAYCEMNEGDGAVMQCDKCRIRAVCNDYFAIPPYDWEMNLVENRKH